MATECFFEKPAKLKKKHPELYDQLRTYYHLDPERCSRFADRGEFEHAPLRLLRSSEIPGVTDCAARHRMSVPDDSHRTRTTPSNDFANPTGMDDARPGRPRFRGHRPGTPRRSQAAAPVAEPFGYCLNTSTIMGQKLPVVEQMQVAAKAGFGAVEPWLRDLDDHVKRGQSLADLKARISRPRPQDPQRHRLRRVGRRRRRQDGPRASSR